MDFSHNPKMCPYQSDVPHEQQVNGLSDENEMPYFVQDCGQWYCFQSMYANVSTYQTSPLCQYTSGFDSSWCDQAAENSETSWWTTQPADLEQPESFYQTENQYNNHLDTVPVSPSLQSTNTLSPSWDSQSSGREISPFPTRLQTPTMRQLRRTTASPAPAVRQSRDTTTSPVPTRIRRPVARSKSRKPKASSTTISRTESCKHWPRHILVRAKILPNENTTEFRYFMVVLHSNDVQLCANAICLKLGIDSPGHKPMRWSNKRACLQGVVDRAFLNGLDDMQDFVVDIVGVGNNGYVELLLEM